MPEENNMPPVYTHNDPISNEKHTFIDFITTQEFHGAEGEDSYTRKCSKCGLTINDTH
jgi:hypothetical protein